MIMIGHYSQLWNFFESFAYKPNHTEICEMDAGAFVERDVLA